MSWRHICWGWVCWGRRCSPVGCSAGTPRLAFVQASRRNGTQQGCDCTQANSRRKLCHFMCRVCQCGCYCFQIQSSNSTWYCLLLCALYCVLQLQVLLTFVRTSYPLVATSLTYGPGARWKDSKTNMTSVWLEKGPRSCRADRPWSDEMMGRSCICWAVLDLWWEELVLSREEERVMQGNGLPHAREPGALQSTRGGLCTTQHAGEWWWIRLWGPGEPGFKLNAAIGTSYKSGISQSGAVLRKVSESHSFNGNQGPVSSLKIALYASVRQL